MKKAIYLLLMAVCAVMTSCEKEEIGGTATQALAGEWYVTADAVDKYGNVLEEDFFGIGHFHVNTYNTAANVPNEIWVDDLGNFWEFKVKASADVNNCTFSTPDSVANAYYDCKVLIEGGKILPDAATTPHGTAADSIVFYVSFNDDTCPEEFGFAKYRISGYRYTGLASDD
ncbi:MAG: hypothetical protein IJC77_04145 [Bacteroidaceae bacterium]|nr:hypothetical protein [Bacteroidaceae bacterium]